MGRKSLMELLKLLENNEIKNHIKQQKTTNKQVDLAFNYMAVLNVSCMVNVVWMASCKWYGMLVVACGGSIECLCM